ncbi:AraC family transcriptional regulator [Psychromonas sp. Urea-02u-13]|uniref:AraC family transcriptional regulator n=1 Tax=Psychromonas sp. Urea-02u-13 TaxID=2058326 RepID=UPI000C33378F|nr:AraC family transcriptional regulator [Psychromonas sp. Urea-02u-13]PKG39100.1 AraC family transcriptional regulator [Psychromonas sp. Urea-02u-13]
MKSCSSSIPIINIIANHEQLLSSFNSDPLVKPVGDCLGCQIHTFSGYGGCAPSQASHSPKKACLRILTVIEGDNIDWHNGKDEAQRLQKGKSVLIFSQSVFNDIFISENESYVEIAEIRFECSYLVDIYQHMSLKFQESDINPKTYNIPLIFDTIIEIQQFTNQLQSQLAGKKSSVTDNLQPVLLAYRCLSKVFNQLELIKHNKHNKADNKYACLSSRTLNKVRKAHSLITTKPGGDWSIKEICKEVGTNETSFKRGFKFLFDNTFSKVLQQARMEVAAKELLDTEKPIIDIVYNIGYSSPSYFSKLFKQYFGEKPLQYRQRRQCFLSFKDV